MKHFGFFAKLQFFSLGIVHNLRIHRNFLLFAPRTHDTQKKSFKTCFVILFKEFWQILIQSISIWFEQLFF
jgi:hypothetical protein